MVVNYFQGLFIIVNSLVAFYIVFYAFAFLSKTKDYPDRRPWEFLFGSAIFFGLSQILALLKTYTSLTLFGFPMEKLQLVIVFVYAALVLLAFITQSHLILMSDMILITKKVDRRKVQKKIPVPSSKEEGNLQMKQTPEGIKFDVEQQKEVDKDLQALRDTLNK